MAKYLFLTAAAALSLAGCSTIVTGSTQTVYFQAVGATEATCEVANAKYKYLVNLPEKVEIKKSRRDLELTCRAAGNRYKTMVVPSELSGWTFANVTNGAIFGVPYDGETGAMFKYPDIIIVDFTDTVASLDALPAYHAVDTLDPASSSAGVENMGPAHNKLPGDDASALRHKMAQLQRDREDAYDAERVERKDTVEGGWTGDKGGADMKSQPGAAYVPPAYVPPTGDDAAMMPAPQPPLNAGPAPSGQAPGKAMPAPLFPSTTSF